MKRTYEVTIREVVERSFLVDATHRSEARRFALSEPDDPVRHTFSDMSDVTVMRVTVVRVAVAKAPQP